MPRLADGCKLEPGYAADRHLNGPPEQSLWLAVLQRAFLDLHHRDPEIKQDALEFITGPDFLKVLDLAGIDRAYAADLQAKAQALIDRSTAPKQVHAPRRWIEARGQTHTLAQWSRISGLRMDTICYL